MADAILADLTRLVTGGVDTHKDTHVAAVVDHLGRELGIQSFSATTDGYRRLAEWIVSHGEVGRVGIEGTGSWGAGLLRYLHELGVEVVEIHRTNRQQRRRNGKSDPLDALAAARSALAGLDAGIPKAGAGPVEAIRLLLLARRTAVKARARTMNQIRSVLDTTPEPVRDRYRHLSALKLVTAISRARPDTTNVAVPAVAAVVALRCLGRRWEFLTEQIDDLDTQLDELVAATAPNLVALHCVGTTTAAALLVAAGDNPGRLGSEAAFAALCGTSPLPAGSGREEHLSGKSR